MSGCEWSSEVLDVSFDHRVGRFSSLADSLLEHSLLYLVYIANYVEGLFGVFVDLEEIVDVILSPMITQTQLKLPQLFHSLF